MTLTAFGTSARCGTLNNRPQARHLIRLSAALRSKIQLLPHLGHRAMICIAKPFTSSQMPIHQPVRRSKRTANILAIQSKTIHQESTACPIISVWQRDYHCD